MDLRVLVVGTGHSGTRWASDVLRACGLRSGHEAIFKESVDANEIGKWEADSSCRSVPWLTTGYVPPTAKVVHLLRDPLAVWRSMYHCASQNGWAWRGREWVERHLGRKLPEDLREFLSAFIVLWDEKIRTTGRVDLIARLEDGDGFTASLGLIPQFHVERMPDYRRAPVGAPAVTWDDLPAGRWKDRLKELSAKHGYIGEIQGQTSGDAAQFRKAGAWPDLGRSGL